MNNIKRANMLGVFEAKVFHDFEAFGYRFFITKHPKNGYVVSEFLTGRLVCQGFSTIQEAVAGTTAKINAVGKDALIEMVQKSLNAYGPVNP